MPTPLLDRVRRDDGPLAPPQVIAEGVTASAEAVWSWVRIPTRSTDESNTDVIARLTIDGASELRRYIPPGASFQFKLQWGKHSGDTYVETELGRLHRPTPGQRRYIELGGQRIEDNAFPDRLVLLGVLIEVDQGSSLTGQLTRNSRKLAGPSGDVAAAEAALHKAVDAAQAFHARMSTSSFGARPATVTELAWSLRRDLRRTVGWLPQGPLAGTGQLARLVNGSYAVPHPDHMQIETDEGTSYVRLLAAARDGYPAHDLELPGGEWLKELVLDDKLSDGPVLPVEVSIRGRNLPAKEAVKRMRDALKLAKEQGREASKGVAEGPSEQLMESRQVLTQRIKEVASGDVAMVADTVTWLIEAPDLASLDARTTTVIDQYGGKGIDLWVPKRVQQVLWKETVLGDRHRFRDTEQLRPWTTLVGGWFHGGSIAGDDAGPLLGGVTGSTPAPYRARLSDAAIQGDPVTTVFTGSTGGGKSTAVMLAILPEVVYGAWGLLGDYKGDLSGIVEVAESFGVHVTTVNTSEQASGAMDPFRYVADPAEAASRAHDNLQMMLGPNAGVDSETIIRRATQEVGRRNGPTHRSTHEAIELMRRSSDRATAAVGEALADLAADPLARPVAGPPDPAARPLPTRAGLVYLRLDGARLPGRNTPEHTWKPGQRLSMMLVQAGQAYSAYMASRVKGIPKVVAWTELHLMTGHASGRDAVHDLARLGRALDVSLLLDTQAVAELVSIEGLLDQVSAAHCFRVKTEEEAVAQCALLGLAPEPHIIKRQMKWLAGQCLVRDRRGRVAPVEFDYLHAWIRSALKTNPERDAPTDDDVDDVETSELVDA